MGGVEEGEERGGRGGGETARDGEEGSGVSAEGESEDGYVGVCGWLVGVGHGERVQWKETREMVINRRMEWRRMNHRASIKLVMVVGWQHTLSLSR